MSHSIRHLHWLFRGIFSLAASSLVALGVASCNNSNNPSNASTLALTPASIQLTAGGAGQQASLLLTAPSGTGAATISVSGLPAGVTISPSVLTATPGVALKLTLTAASSSASGTSTITFTATVGGQMVSAQASLSIQAAAPPDFSLGVTPPAVTLSATGTPVTVSLLATPLNGFSSSVQVTLSGLPAGVAAQPSTLTLTPGTAATISLTAPTGTAAAMATATLTATSGTLTHTASLPITVVVMATSPDFSIAATPASLSLTPGGTGQPVQLAATALNGFTGSINIAISGLPAGVTATPASLSLTSGTPQSVTLTAANSAQLGSASVVFTGTAGSLTHTATVALSLVGLYRRECNHVSQRQRTRRMVLGGNRPYPAKRQLQHLWLASPTLGGRQGRRAATLCEQPFDCGADA